MIKILIIVTASFLPIWRAAPDKANMNVWEYLIYTGTKEYQDSHIKYESALMKAGSALVENRR